jgi:hypothetical protein
MEEIVWQLPTPSQEFDQGPEIILARGTLTLRWDREHDDGSYTWTSAEFTGVEDAEWTAHDSCSPDQVRAYDRVVRLEPSDRMERLRGASSKFLHHFRIYFDGIGCLDVVAEEFRPPTRT